MAQQRIMVGMSGGVDSSVAALLLKQQGYRVEGLFMKNWEDDDDADYCAAADDLRDAREVAERVGIPLHSVNFAAEYWDRVFAHFLAEYRAARTPNPDILCNREIKFKAFLDHARSLGAEAIATGHYARVACGEDGCHLLQAADPGKDQTYFLYPLGPQQLSRTLFPLGDLRKRQVRTIARQAGFPNYRKKDSTGICFIGERKFRDFLSRYLPAQPGDIETPEGKRIGRHRGLAYYTIGQRQGLGIGGRRDADQSPWFAVGKDVARNALIAVQGHDHPLLLHRCLKAEQLHWVRERPPAPLPFVCEARIRHRQPLQGCEIVALRHAGCQVRFFESQRAIAAGQSVVFYRGADCLGGGVIEQAFDPE